MYSAIMFEHRMDTEFGYYYTSAEDISPEVQTNFVAIPGMNGTLNLTEQDGLVFYNSVDKEWCFEKVTKHTWPEDIIKEARKLRNKFLGVSGEVVFDYDPEYYVKCTVTGIDVSCEDEGRLVALFRVHCQPYRLRVVETVVSAYVNDSFELDLVNAKMPVSPKVTVDSQMILSYTVRGTEYTATVSEGSHVIDTLILYEGVTHVSISGDGNIEFTYRQGSF